MVKLRQRLDLHARRIQEDEVEMLVIRGDTYAAYMRETDAVILN